MDRRLNAARKQPGDRLAEGERAGRVAVVDLLPDTDKEATTLFCLSSTWMAGGSFEFALAPAGPCTAPKTVAVDYTANYVFWAPK